MISLSKIVASVALASVLAAGSAYALLTPTGEPAGMHNHFAVPFTQGFAAGDGWNCAIGGAPVNVALTFENRWNGLWEGVNNGLRPLVLASCTNGWAYGYLDTPDGQPSTVANVQAINLSTLPLMR